MSSSAVCANTSRNPQSRINNQREKQDQKRASSTYSLWIDFRIRDILAIAFCLLSVDNPVNNDMRDMDTLGPEFTSQRLGHSAGSELAHRERRQPSATLESSGGT